MIKGKALQSPPTRIAINSKSLVVGYTPFRHAMSTVSIAGLAHAIETALRAQDNPDLGIGPRKTTKPIKKKNNRGREGYLYQHNTNYMSWSPRDHTAVIHTLKE